MRWRATIAICLCSAPAFAQGNDADTLFKRGVKLLDHGEVKAACDQFKASYDLDPAPGTLFNLAGCHERDGRLLAARTEYLELAKRMEQQGKADKAQVARDHARALEAKLARLELAMPASGAPASITLDGTDLPSDAVGAPIFVTEGAHTFVFAAPGKPSLTKSVTAVAGQATTVPVPAFDQTAAPTVGPTSSAPPAPAAPEAPEKSASSGGSPIGWIVGGAGVALVGGGAFFGLRAFSQKSDADAACGGTVPHQCIDDAHTAAARASQDSARTSALISTIMTGAGVVAIGTGVYLVLSNWKTGDEKRSGRVRIVPALGPNGAGGTLSGVF